MLESLEEKTTVQTRVANSKTQVKSSSFDWPVLHMCRIIEEDLLRMLRCRHISVQNCLLQNRDSENWLEVQTQNKSSLLTLILLT